jgi:hypothetical protein
MSSKVRMIAALAFAFALGAGAARAVPPPAPRPQAPVSPTAGLVDAARAWLGSWTGVAAGGSTKISTARGHEGSNIDPNGLVATILKALPQLPPKTGCIPPS